MTYSYEYSNWSWSYRIFGKLSDNPKDKVLVCTTDTELKAKTIVKALNHLANYVGGNQTDE